MKFGFTESLCDPSHLLPIAIESDKQGYDFFEEHRRPPVVGVENKRYVFFDTEEAVPDQFKVVASGDTDPGQPTLITGWATGIPQ